MSFLDQLKKQNQETSSNFNDAVYPSSSLKNPELEFKEENNNKVLVRVLPPATPDSSYNFPFRQVFLETTNPNNVAKKYSLVASLSAYPNAESELERAINQWQAEGRMPARFANTKPRPMFFMNVVTLVQGPQGLTEAKDANGNLIVQVLKVPVSAVQAINEQLMNPMLRPAFGPEVPSDWAEYSFISPYLGYPVEITKPRKGSDAKQYSVNVYPNLPLGPLPDNWDVLLEDLAYQAKPTEEINPDYVKLFINTVNGVVTPRGGNKGLNPNQFNQQPPVQQQQQQFNQQPPVVNDFNSLTSQQPPVQQQQFNQQYQAPTRQYQAPTQQYQAPVQQEAVQPQPQVTAQEPVQQQQQASQAPQSPSGTAPDVSALLNKIIG